MISGKEVTDMAKNKSKLITKPQLKSYILEGLSTLRQMCDNNDGLAVTIAKVKEKLVDLSLGL